MGRLNIILALWFFCVLNKASAEKSDNCERATAFVARAIKEMFAAYPDKVDFFKTTAKNRYGFDLDDDDGRNTIICAVVDSKNLEDLFAALPKEMAGPTMDDFLLFYEGKINQEIKIGGYTNNARFNSMVIDIAHYGVKALKMSADEKKVKATHFFKAMQVKYGSRWLQLICQDDSKSFYIKNAKEFVKKYYESTAEEFAKEMGMSEYQVRFMSSILDGRAFGSNVLDYATQFRIFAEGINLVGDMGLFNLE